MIKYYRTMDHQIHEISEPMEGTWISLIHPTAAELAKIATDYKIDIDDLRAPLDEEERSHIEVEEGYTLFIVDVPTTEEKGKRILPDDSMWYHPDRESDHYGLSGRYSSVSRL